MTVNAFVCSGCTIGSGEELRLLLIYPNDRAMKTRIRRVRSCLFNACFQNHGTFMKCNWMSLKGITRAAVILTVISAFTPSNAAPVVDTVTRITASDSRANLFFGLPVQIDNGTAAVSALDFGHGAVYIFDLVNGNWVQTQKLVDPLVADFDVFGDGLALQGDLLVTSDNTGGTNPPTSGQVFVYRRVGGTYFLEQILEEPNPPPRLTGLGNTVALSGNTIAAGNTQDDTVIHLGGAVSVFTANGTNWSFQTKLLSPNPTDGGQFGSGLAIDGDTLIAGQAFDSNFFGAAYVFVRNGTNWTLQQKLSPPDSTQGSGFGTAIAIEGDTAVIGAGAQAANGVSGSGAAYVYHRTGTTWTLQQELVRTPNEADAGFGISVAIHNGLIVVGAPFLPTGVADVFEFNGASWVQVQELVATNPQIGSRFGFSVDVGQSGIISGAFLEDLSDTVRSSGAAYIFSSSQTNGPVILSATATPNVLWPPNHKLVPVTVSVTAQGNLVSCVILGVTSNQPANGKGDGNTSPDIVRTGDLSLLLRAEHAGNIKSDRVYTITVLCADTFGNTTRTNVFVTVPHDQGK